MKLKNGKFIYRVTSKDPKMVKNGFKSWPKLEGMGAETLYLNVRNDNLKREFSS